ncbi:MAG TPA: hypothetical protein PLH25_06215 [Flavobacterium sp.]|nr:hypothetical protein [Flavobacterium sp.]HQW69245.1 hypothetical protein [Flavobacterium sp.]
MTEQIKTSEQSNFETDKSRDLILSLALDLVGMATFLIPALGEIGDLLWAPIAGYMMTRIYKGASGKVAGVFAFLEEIIPFTDFIPTFTLMWIYTYVFKREKKEL